ncbi:uncharacterized protein [Choristoneura fumiferana]|uniref:uncharacterized protein n=1 Tax=Choristoneura fumiferana TaxID=7141 RepID=UPI003D157A19
MLNRSNMNISPNSSLMQRTLDLQYENKKRASSLKWSVINGVLFVVFVYDLSCKCPGYTSAFHYAEYALALLLGFSLLQHSYQLIWRSPPLTITTRQRELLGVADADTSFRIHDTSTKSSPSNRSMDTSELSISLSPRGWRNPEAGSRSASASPPEPLSYSRIDSNADKFIADSSSLSDYLKSYEERSFLESTLNTSGSPPVPVPHYHLASIDTESKLDDSGSNDRSGLGGAPQVWWRLQLDPQRLTHWNLNLRLWLHVTIFERLVREMAAVDESLARAGLHDVKLGQVSVERLRQSTKTVGCGSLAAVLPFLEAFPDQKYIVRRIKELAVGGCLSNYKWNGGARTTTTLNQPDLPGGAGGRVFSTEHVSSGGAPPAPGRARRAPGMREAATTYSTVLLLMRHARVARRRHFIAFT